MNKTYQKIIRQLKEIVGKEPVNKLEKELKNTEVREPKSPPTPGYSEAEALRSALNISKKLCSYNK